MAEPVLRVGALVVCTSKSFRDQLGLEPDAGIYLVDRRRDGLVYFARLDRSAWIPKGHLRPLPAGDARVAAAPAWVARLDQALRILDAAGLELERLDQGGFSARIFCSALGMQQILHLKELVGAAADRIGIRPGSMSRLVVEIPTAALDRPRPAS